MRNKILWILLVCVHLSMFVKAQPAVENNCFKNFQENAEGRSNINAYLLSYINWLNYPERLSKNTGHGDDPNGPFATSLQRNGQAFENEFRNRFEHMFWDPVAPKAPLPPTGKLKAITAQAPNGIKIGTAGFCSLAVTPAQRDAVASSSVNNPNAIEPIQDYSNTLVTPACQAGWNKSYAEYRVEYAKYKLFHNQYVADFGRWKSSKPHIEFLHKTVNQQLWVDPTLKIVKDGKIDLWSLDPEVIFISTPKFIIIAFRGTDRVKSDNGITFDKGEWIGTNFLLPLTEAKNILSGKFHTGMLLSFLTIKDELVNKLKEYNADKSKPVWVTGHSLGGGLAAIFTQYNAVQSSTMKYKTHTYTYAAPGTVGDADVAYSLSDKYLPAFSVPQRYEFRNDMITWLGLPVSGPFGSWVSKMTNFYSMYGQRIFISEEGGNHMNYHFRNRETSDLDFNAGKYPKGCDHNPEWYVRATYDYLSADEKIKVPANAFRPSTAPISKTAYTCE